MLCYIEIMANIFLGVGDGKDKQIYNRSFCTADSGLFLMVSWEFSQNAKKNVTNRKLVTL